MKKRFIAVFALIAALCMAVSSSLFAQTTKTTKTEQSTETPTKSSADLAAESNIDAKLQALEAQVYAEETVANEAPTGFVEAVTNSAIQSMNPNISFVLDTAAAWFSGKNDLRGGHDPKNFGFNLQGLEMSVRADVGPYFRFQSAIVFHLFGVEVEEAFASTLALPWQFQLRAGQFKTRLGRLNPTHLHSWAFATQPLVNAKFLGSESMRGLGVELSRLALWIPGTFRWYLAFQNITGEETGRSFVPSSADIESYLDLTLTARAEEFVALAPNWDLLVGASYANGRNKSGRENRTEIFGADTYLKWRSRTHGGRTSVGWQTEAMLRRRQVPGGVLQDFGLYSWLQWRINRHWGSGIRYEFVTGIDPETGDDSLFGQVNPAGVVDPLDPAWTETRHRGAIQLSYIPSHFSRIRLQYALDHLPYRQGDAEQWVHMIMLQAEFVVGAHGAHTY